MANAPLVKDIPGVGGVVFQLLSEVFYVHLEVVAGILQVFPAPDPGQALRQLLGCSCPGRCGEGPLPPVGSGHQGKAGFWLAEPRPTAGP